MKEKLFTRNFTLLLLGQVFSLLGNGALRFALSMYVLEKTGSAAVFGTLLAVSMVPTILLTPFGGVLADRMDRRIIMVGLDLTSGAAVLAAAAAFADGRGLAVTAALLIVLSVLGAFESPTVQACVPQMLHGENVLRGNAAVNQV
ncbi:MAG: MFS transporter, partial [Oscillospiraceae bacterium]|nr:MFS transporter [Oscillospiraceae bacterium]